MTQASLFTGPVASKALAEVNPDQAPTVGMPVEGRVFDYRIDVLSGCVIVYGELPFEMYPVVAAMAQTNARGKDLVMDLDLQTRLGAHLVQGRRENLELISLSAPARAIATTWEHRLPAGLYQWLRFGLQSDASKFAAHALTGYPFDFSYPAPHPVSPDDFRRCRLLLESAPSLQASFSNLAKHSESWSRLVTNWEVLEGCMDREHANWRAPQGHLFPQTFKLLRSVLGRDMSVAESMEMAKTLVTDVQDLSEGAQASSKGRTRPSLRDRPLVRTQAATATVSVAAQEPANAGTSSPAASTSAEGPPVYRGIPGFPPPQSLLDFIAQQTPPASPDSAAAPAVEVAEATRIARARDALQAINADASKPAATDSTNPQRRRDYDSGDETFTRRASITGNGFKRH